MILLDTSAWIEYFSGSPKGSKIDSMILSNKVIGTPVIVLIELACKSFKENVDFQLQEEYIKQNSIILPLEEEMATLVARNYVDLRNKNKKISLADAIILTTAQKNNATLVTCDGDFRSMHNVELVN